MRIVVLLDKDCCFLNQMRSCDRCEFSCEVCTNFYFLLLQVVLINLFWITFVVSRKAVLVSSSSFASTKDWAQELVNLIICLREVTRDNEQMAFLNFSTCCISSFCGEQVSILITTFCLKFLIGKQLNADSQHKAASLTVWSLFILNLILP